MILKSDAESLKVLHLEPDASLSDVKKAYRKMAKENHPDRFTDTGQKKAQQQKMAEINEAYHSILAGFDTHKEETPNEKAKESDYDIYKRGFDAYSRYNRAHLTREKVSQLKTARDCFIRLLNEYPESDWSSDAEEKLKIIGSIGESFIESHFEYTQKRSK